MSESETLRIFIEQRIPDEQVRNAVLNALADVVTAVHNEDHDVWSLTFPQAQQIRLNIGNVEAFKTSRNAHDTRFMILSERQSAEEFVRKHDLPDSQFDLAGFNDKIASERGIHRFYIDGHHFAAYSSELLEMWRQAALALATAYHRTKTWNAHSPETLLVIGEAIGRTLPQPHYGAVDENSGLAIYDALSDEAKSAVDALPSDVLAGEVGSMAARILAEAIQCANPFGSGIWSIICDSATNGRVFLCLNIANTNLISFDAGTLKLVIDSTEPALAPYSTLVEELSTDAVYGSNENLRQIALPTDESLSDTGRSALIRANLIVVEEFASLDWKQNQRANWHRDDWRVTLAKITQMDVPSPEYVPGERVGLPMDSPNTPDDAIEAMNDGNMLREGFTSFGLTYTDAQLASFYTALQTKGFVILSGISGTGKSKIAQRFSNMLPDVKPAGNSRSQVPEPPEDSEFHRISIHKYMAKFKRFYIPKPVSDLFPFPDPGTNFDVPLSIDGAHGEARVRVRQGSSGVYVLPKGELRTTFAQLAGPAFYLRIQVDEDADQIQGLEIVTTSNTVTLSDTQIIVKVTEKSLETRQFGLPWAQAKTFPFPELEPSVQIPVNLPGMQVQARLATTGGNHFQIDLKKDAKPFLARLVPGDSFLVTPIVRGDVVVELRIDYAIPPDETPQSGDSTQDSNHLFLPVRPDWRDGKALIGYHNPLSGEYVRTEFLDFVIAAGDDYRAGHRNAFFVILDEMNLAHVEYYFADVLSVIESGRDYEGWTVEGIPLNAGEEDADLPERLHLPPNLYIIGTVNMDETTHPFSAKVLDRAFTIELTEVDFTGYPTEAPPDLEVSDDDKQALLQAFTQDGRYPRIDKGDIRLVVERHERYRADLQSLNTSLRRSRMHFGYRVFDEIMQFVHNAGQNGLFTPDEAFDHAVLMKVLPKFNGSRGKLQNALFDLMHWCRREGALTPEVRNALDAQFTTLMEEGRPFDSVVIVGEDSIDDNWRYPATGKRAALMMQDLYTEGFASFG